MGRQSSRYSTALGDEGEFEPGSRGLVLKNLLGITSKREMDRMENEALIKTEDYFDRTITANTVITVDLIKEIYRHLLGNIYSWGGKLRTVEMSKGNYPFPPTIYLVQSLDEFERDVLQMLTPLNPNQTDIIPLAIAEVHAEFLAIHPFREGNGRVARIIARLMAFQASKAPPYYGFTGKGSKVQNKRYLYSVFEGYRKNYEPLARFFEEALDIGGKRLLADSTHKTGRLSPVAPSNTLDSYADILSSNSLCSLLRFLKYGFDSISGIPFFFSSAIYF